MEKEEIIKEEEKKLEDFVNAIYQNISTAIQSINEIEKVTEDQCFLKELKKEKDGYNSVKAKLLTVCEKIKVEPKDNNMFEKARLFTSIKVTTLADRSTRHLAEMMLLGSVMGTTTCYKDLCDYKDTNGELYEVLQTLMGLEEEYYNNLKTFLKELKD
ncbi:MAG: hypothetical protein ACI4T1_01060 [Christensenellales bacterium]